MATYRQRYFVCKCDQASDATKKLQTIFFYFGNEDSVELYVNNTGLMWESASEFDAVMVFLEHRYYGKSVLFEPGREGCMEFLTTDQALLDASQFLSTLKANPKEILPKKISKKPVGPIIGFGGSYGGMIASWFRMRFPHLIDGVIAGSAPILSFEGLRPAYDNGGYMRVVTQDASPLCARNFLRAQKAVYSVSQSEEGREFLKEALLLCEDFAREEILNLISWMQDPWSFLAMGEYPYSSSYLTHGKCNLPPKPLSFACQYLEIQAKSIDLPELLNATRYALGVFYNCSQDVQCFFNGNSKQMQIPRKMGSIKRFHSKEGRKKAEGADLSCVGDWGYQWCTEMFQPFSNNGIDDMFWPPHLWNAESAIAGCKEAWGVKPRSHWAVVRFGDRDLSAASNILFSNGLLDPWYVGGVLKNVSSNVRAIVLESGAHHLDFMFSNPLDPPEVVEARKAERNFIRDLVKAHNMQR